MSEDWDYLAISRYIRHLEEEAEAAGIRLELRGDFGHFTELCGTLEDKPHPTAMFDPMKSDVGSHNGFYMKGYDKVARSSTCRPSACMTWRTPTSRNPSRI